MTFFSGLEQDPAIAEKVKASLKSIIDLLDPGTERGKKFAESFTKMLDAIAGPGADAFGKLMESMPQIVEAVSALANAFSGPLGKAIGFFIEQAASIGKAVSGIINWISGLGEKLGGLNLITGFLSALMGGSIIETIVTWIQGMIGSVGSTLTAGGSSLGSSLIAGIVQGITGGASSVVSAMVSMAQSAISAGKSALGIHSPSLVAEEEIGAMVPEGAAKGVRDNMDVMDRAMAPMREAVSAVPYAGDAIASRVATQAKLGARTNYFGGMRAQFGNIITQAQSAGGGQSQAEDFAAQFWQMFERLSEAS
jgi:phage-related protein